MEACLQHFLTQSVFYTLFAVMFIAFFESLAFLGFLLPGTVMMASVGALIGNGDIHFYSAWLAGILGCLSGDWISYFVGRVFEKPLHGSAFLKKYQTLLDKTEKALHRHNMATLFFGRFIGITRPIIPMLAGMLKLPLSKFALPNIIACLIWPPVYFLPGILWGVTIGLPKNINTVFFKWSLLSFVSLTFLLIWLSWRWYFYGKKTSDRLSGWLSLSRLQWLISGVLAATILGFINLFHQSLTSVYGHLLWKVLTIK